MQRSPPQNTNSRDVTRRSKRMLVEISPDVEKRSVGNLDVAELMRLMKDLLEENLQNLATKNDLLIVSANVDDLTEKVKVLTDENKALVSEVNLLKAKMESEKTEIKRLIDDSNRKNLVFKGIEKQTFPEKAVKKICEETLGVEANTIRGVKPLYERGNKMAVKVEFSTEAAVGAIFRNIKKLAGSTISVENDLSVDKREEKQVLLQLKREIRNMDATRKIQVLGNRMKIENKWFKWDKHKILVSGEEKATKVLNNIYGNKFDDTNLNFNNLVLKMKEHKVNSKN